MISTVVPWMRHPDDNEHDVWVIVTEWAVTGSWGLAAQIRAK